jgi:hypothetical protein
MTPDQYRTDYGLPREYPMVAPNYSEQRRTLAHSIGLGRRRPPAAEAGETGATNGGGAAGGGRGRGKSGGASGNGRRRKKGSEE